MSRFQKSLAPLGASRFQSIADGPVPGDLPICSSYKQVMLHDEASSGARDLGAKGGAYLLWGAYLMWDVFALGGRYLSVYVGGSLFLVGVYLLWNDLLSPSPD
jgi:hypothetical protein